MDSFFNRSPGVVSRELLGMTIDVNGQEAVIEQASPKSPKQNEHWTDRPLFDSGVEAYVAPYRGTFLTFLRTGPEGRHSCVRLDIVETEKERVVGPGHVSRLLGLEAEQVGRVSLQNDIVVVNFDL